MLSKNGFNLEFYSTQTIAKVIAMKVREKRLYFNLTQQALSKKSGVSLGSLKRFERTHEISLHSLLLLAIALQSTDEFLSLFTANSYQSIDEIIKQKKTIKRKRGRNNV